MRILLIGHGYVGSYLRPCLEEAGCRVIVCEQAVDRLAGVAGAVHCRYQDLTIGDLASFDTILWFAGHSSVPMALKVAEVGGWRLPFIAVAALGLLVAAGAIFFLPPVRGHLDAHDPEARQVGVRELLGRTDVRLSYAMTAVVISRVPSIAAASGSLCSSSWCRYAFSRTMIASSTTMPIARMSPRSVSELIE